MNSEFSNIRSHSVSDNSEFSDTRSLQRVMRGSGIPDAIDIVYSSNVEFSDTRSLQRAVRGSGIPDAIDIV